MKLEIERPLVFFDLETTGTDKTKDRITQFCFHVYYPDGDMKLIDELVNPGQPIPHAVAELTGITDERVRNLPTLQAHAATIHSIIADADLVGFGCLLFDVPVLFQELSRCGITWDYTKNNIIDAGNIYKRNVPRDLSAAFLFYCNKTLDGAHNARKDVEATRYVFLHQIVKHALTTDIRKLALYSNFDKPLVDLSGKFSLDSEGDVVFNFSAKKGEKVKHNTGLLQWMLDKDFTEDVKIVCRQLLDKHLPTLSTSDLPF